MPDAEKDRGEDAGVDDIGEEEGDDDLIIGPFGPGDAFADKVHEADVAFPDEEGDDDEEEVAGGEFRDSVETICDESG